MFKSILRSLGVGGASVETTIDDPDVEAGGALAGRVRVVGGSDATDARAVVLEVVTRCLVESGDAKSYAEVVVGADDLGPVRVAAGETRELPFRIALSAAAPLSVGSTSSSLRTRLDVAGAVDPRDTDPIRILPTPTMRAVFDGLERAGFRLVEAEVEYDRRRRNPFVQEFDFRPTSRGDWGIEEVEIAFDPVPGGLEVRLTVDRRGGLFLGGGERSARFRVPDAEARRLDLARELRRAIDSLR